MNPFATHQIVLKRAIELTSGPILEMGAGDGSTPFIHILAPGRKIVTLETDASWLQRFMYMQNPFHVLIGGVDYEEFDVIVRQYYDIAFIDHAPGERRNVDIAKVTDCRFVIIHDTHDPAYEYEKILPLYKFRYDFKGLIPHTSVLSNIDDLNGFHDL